MKAKHCIITTIVGLISAFVGFVVGCNVTADCMDSVLDISTNPDDLDADDFDE